MTGTCSNAGPFFLGDLRPTVQSFVQYASRRTSRAGTQPTSGRRRRSLSWQVSTGRSRSAGRVRTYLEAYTPRPSFGTWYFPSPKGRRYDVDNFSQKLRAANQAAVPALSLPKGLPWTCLDYRHTFGSQLAIEARESLYKIATLMGNSPEICRRHYAALVPEALLSTVEFGSSHKSLDALEPRSTVSLRASHIGAING